MSVLLLALLLIIRHKLIQRVAAKVKPRVRRFLAATGFDWRQLETALARGGDPYRRLKCHLLSHRYDDVLLGVLGLRSQDASDDGLAECLLPQRAAQVAAG